MSDSSMSFTDDFLDAPLDCDLRRPAHILVPPPPLKYLGRPDSPGCRTACEASAPWEEEFYQQPAARQLSSQSLALPSPRWQPDRLENGTYVAFSVDLQALAAHCTSGPIAAEHVLEFPVRRYAALVSRSDDDTTDFADDADDNVRLYLLGRTPPPDCAEHALPVAPTTGAAAHALETDMLLPWCDALQWTALGTPVTVSAVHDSPLRFSLRADAWARFEAAAEAGSGHGPPLHHATPTTPVQVWRNVREAKVLDDPAEFFEELKAVWE